MTTEQTSSPVRLRYVTEILALASCFNVFLLPFIYFILLLSFKYITIRLLFVCSSLPMFYLYCLPTFVKHFEFY